MKRDEVEAAKSQARRAAFSRRRIAHGRAGPDTARLLSETLLCHRGVPLAGYIPIRTEIDPLPVMAAAAACGPVGVPVIQDPGQPLGFARWQPGVEMGVGAFGVPVPVVREWLEPDILVVPLLAFDCRGNRLGYGGGYYDRTLARLRSKRSVLAVGFAYDAQEVDGLPLASTDQRLDMIVTESRVLDFVM